MSFFRDRQHFSCLIKRLNIKHYYVSFRQRQLMNVNRFMVDLQCLVFLQRVRRELLAMPTAVCSRDHGLSVRLSVCPFVHHVLLFCPEK